MEKSLAKKLYVPSLIGSLIAIFAVAAMPYLGEVGMANPKSADEFGLWVNFLGRFHPLFLHLPIGALMLVFVMEGAKLLSFGKYRPNTTMALFFASATAVFAVVFGYCLYLTGSFEGELIEEHKRDGIIFTIAVIIAFIIRYTAYLKPGVAFFKPLYGITLLASGAVMISAGHHGGEITHGDPMNALPSKILEKREAVTSAPVIVDPVVYTDIVHSILAEKCISCHGPDKQKSGLRVDTYAYMLEGGEEDECLVPGSVEESGLITSLHLPMDDDLHMPPEGKKQLSAEEIQILEWWVRSGAPETARLSEVEVTPEVEAALSTLVTPEERERRAQAAEAAKQSETAADAKKRAALASALKSVNDKFPGSLTYIAQDTTDLAFTVVSFRKSFGDADLSNLDGVAEAVTEIDLGASQVTDQGIAKLAAFPNLRTIKLNGTAVSDKGLQALAGLEHLESVNLYNTAITDAGLKALHGKTKLVKVYLWQTQVTGAGVKELEQSLHTAQSGVTQPDGTPRKAEIIRGTTG
ncbi:hypothetical protein JO972_07085 [Verrucomicrobiaceae bacterium 5K15]|uniref:Cytochrome C Planctomycete-type domain-containing protein n=1 Tax=Oceaniferula flava TaxID=2800421 RepID=A0AAE2SAT8_9BACT|nr:c-type cytochrome domain-containing protein [Oceaniferula flavus]MBK1854716.1 hypothetical protein [Oceaniferula flavus]MBM1136022.1 hypothetical protein [Oceaniferula flavus]